MTVTLIATFTALPGHRDDVADLIAAFAEVVRREPGNIVFDPYTADDADHDFLVYEQYRDDESFAAHLANPAGVPFNEALARHIVGEGSHLRFLHEVDRGDRGEGPNG
jgi:quinol monooxygenase YgiN